MLAISLTLVVLISAIVLCYQYATGALSPDETAIEPGANARAEEPATSTARAA